MPGSQNPAQSCARCGRRDQPGHGCDRTWRLPLLRIVHTGFKRSGGSISHLSWSLHWRWRDDAQSFHIRPSLGTHLNVSEQGRREERNLAFYHDDPDDDVPPSEIVRRHAQNGGA